MRATEVDLNATKLDKLLSVAALASPNSIAIIDPERGEVSYRALIELVRQIAQTLLSAGVNNNDRVGICAPKSIGTVAAIFASLSRGACYVPVDPGAPPGRNGYIFRDCAVKAVLVDRPLAATLEAELIRQQVNVVQSIALPMPAHAGVELVLLVLEKDQPETPDCEHDLAYILYTSGSTGKPKGVLHSHATALSFIDWSSGEFQPTRNDRFSSHAPFHFDLSIFDLYVSIKHQATLVLIGEEVGKQPMLLAPLIAEQKISIWYSTPSVLRLLLDFGELEDLDCSALRLILYAGEVFPLKHLQALHRLLPVPKYYNLYGPTETNVCTFRPVPTPVPNDELLPQQIGTVCSGDRARVVNGSGEDVDRGVEGELWIAGDSVHLGYWNQPDINAEVFRSDDAGVRWYRTGDLVVDQGKGEYLFLGRRDRMVKRRGFRVELGEIENTLYKHPDIGEVAVIAVSDKDSGVQLRALIQWTGNGSPSILALKRFSSENLLSYMIPDRFIFIDALPRTSTDKIDYQRLKDL